MGIFQVKKCIQERKFNYNFFHEIRNKMSTLMNNHIPVIWLSRRLDIRQLFTDDVADVLMMR